MGRHAEWTIAACTVLACSNAVLDHTAALGLTVYDDSLYYLDTTTDTPGVYSAHPVLKRVSTNGGIPVPVTGGSVQVLAQNEQGAAGIVADSGSVYWFDAVADGKIMKIAIGGGAPVALASARSPYAMAVDSSSVYWADDDEAIKRVAK